MLGVGIGLVIAAVLRAIWGLSSAYERSSPMDPTVPFGWDTARADHWDHSDRAARDRPKEIADLVERAPTNGLARLTVEIRTPPTEDAPDFPEPARPMVRVPIPRVDRDALHLSQRILLHLQRLGVYPPNEVAPMGATQAGMTEALHVGQSSLTKVLTRLTAAGALTEARGHVEGAPRRLKVYRLTSLGESIARDLRRRPPSGISSTSSAERPPRPH